MEYTPGDGYSVSSLRTLKYGSSLLSVFFKVRPDGENIIKDKVEYICISWGPCKFSLNYGVMSECYCFLAALGMSCPQLWKDRNIDAGYTVFLARKGLSGDCESA